MDVIARRQYCITEIEQASQQTTGGFDSLARVFEGSPLEALSTDLLHCGIIPEQFAHDSTQVSNTY